MRQLTPKTFTISKECRAECAYKTGMDDTPISAAEEFCEETQAWLQARGFQTLGELAKASERELTQLPEFEDYFLWEIEDALKAQGLALRFEPPPEFDAKLGVLTLDEWVRRLSATSPHASELTPEGVRATIKKRGMPLADYEARLPPSQFKYVLAALAKEQAAWMYSADWKGPRDEAARAFEKLLSLPAMHLTPASDVPLSLLAGDANAAAAKLGTTDRIVDDLVPYDDTWVFLCVTKELRDALIAQFVIAPKSQEDYATRGEGPVTLSMSTELESVDAFANDALNLLQNVNLRTVEDLVAKTSAELRKYKHVPGAVSHIQDVLARAGLRLKS